MIFKGQTKSEFHSYISGKPQRLRLNKSLRLNRLNHVVEYTLIVLYNW